MALWNKVSSGFDTDDETVNFGARTVAESDGSIYETSTIAVIQSDGEVAKNPRVLASIQYSLLCVAIDKSITIFSDESCRRITLSIGFESLITCYCMSKKSDFLFVVLNNGTLYCLNLLTEGRLVFSRDIITNGAGYGDIIVKVFLEDQDDNTLDIMLVSMKGGIYRVTKFDAIAVDAALLEDDETRVEELTKDIECSQLPREFQSREVKSVEVGMLCGERSVVMIGRDVCIWPSDCFCLLDALPYTYVKMQFLQSDNVMLCLRADGALNVVCPLTLLGKKVWNGPACDFITVQDGASDPPQILALMVPKNGSSTTSLQLISFPDFEIKFKLEVPKTTYLVDLVGCCIEDVIFLEGTSSTAETVETVRVKAIVESLPECRLQRLLRRERYDDAENFARRFGLSMETIHCSKAALLMNQLGPWVKSSDVTAKLNEFITTLDRIKDIKYVFECCNNAIMRDYENTRRLLLYAHERLMQDAVKSNSEHITKHLSTLGKTLLRLETFEIIQRTKGSAKKLDSEDINEWVRFSKADLLQECIIYLKLGEQEAAALIWARHSQNFSSRLNLEIIRDMLEAIPEKTPPHRLWPWLSHFVPSLLPILPDALSEIVLWGFKKTKSFEKFQHCSWPQVGLSFAKGLMALLNFEESQMCFHLQQQYASRNSPLQRLTALIQALTDLQQLKANHRIVVRIDAYMGEPMEVAHLLLNRVYPEGIPQLVDNFLQQYMLHHSLKNDHVLTFYIQKTLNNSKGWWFWEEAPWEQRVASVISCIHNMQNRLQQTLETLRKAPVPWSPTMLALADTSNHINHPLLAAIRAESNSVAMKLILKKYGYQHIGLNTTLISYIIKQNRNEMMEDILELTKTNHPLRIAAISLCTNYYLNKGNVEKAMNVINSVDDEVATYCCEQIINCTNANLRLKVMDDQLGYYVEALGTVEVKLREINSHSKSNVPNYNDALLTVSELRSLYCLRKEFGVNLTLTQYQTVNHDILQNYIKRLSDAKAGRWLLIGCIRVTNQSTASFQLLPSSSVTNKIHLPTEIENDSLPLYAAYKKSERIADLLGISRAFAVCLLLEATQNVDILKHYIERVKGSGISSAEECSVMNRFCMMSMFVVEQEEFEATSIVKYLSGPALTNCYNDELPNISLASVWSNLYARVIGYDSIGNTDMENEIAQRSNWKLYTMYTDAAVCSRQTIILPFLRDSLKFYLYYADKKKFYSKLTMSTKEEIEGQLKGLIFRVKQIQMEHYDYSLLQIMSTLYFSFCSLIPRIQQVVHETQLVLYHCLTTFLRKLISSRSFDLQLGLSCLFLLSEQDASKWLNAACKSYQADYSRLRTVSELGYEYCRLTGNESRMRYFEYHRVRYHWARSLSDYGISHKEILNSDTESKQDILERVMSSRKSGLIQLLEEFCTDFEFDLDECFILYLEVLLKKWNPTLNVTTKPTGQKELIMCDNEVAELNRRCKEVAARIEDKLAMKNHIANLWSQVNFYHYEVFLLMMDLLEDKSEKRINHFCFLQNYPRTGRPTQIEREEWAQQCPENSILPAISEWRLPFLPKVDQWKLITPELNLTTYEKWIEVSSVLDLQVHIICTLAIKGAVAQAWGNVDIQRNSQEWSLHPKNSALLKDIKICIEHMTGPEALYYGTAVLYFVVNHTPPGADQAAAAQECYVCAQKWAQNSIQFDQAMIEKIKYKYLQFTSKHILHTHGLGEDRYLRLAVYPDKLVRELYLDESIALRGRGATQHRPDINSAVNALGKIFSLNIVKLRLELLQEWLQPEIREVKLNDSITETFSIVPSDNHYNATNDDNLLRACYVLECGDVEMSANFLINIGFGEGLADDFGPGIRFRALQVLRSIIDTTVLEEFTKRDIQSVRQYMKSLQYLSELEALGLAYSVNGFESCSKPELAQALWRTHAYSPRALSLILQICIDFRVQNYSLWDMTLNQMAKLSMVRELRKVLPVVGTVSHMVGCSGYIAGWQVIISEPFRRADTPPSQEQLDECIMALSLLHACPVVGKLDLKVIMKHCFYCRQPQLAAALLPFLSKDAKDHLVETIKKTFDVRKVVEDLKALSSGGILTITYSSQILMEELQVDTANNLSLTVCKPE